MTYIDKYRQDRRTVVDNTEMFASDILANKTDTRMYKVYIYQRFFFISTASK